MKEQPPTAPDLSVDDLMALVDMSRELAAVLDLRVLLPRILASACGLTGSPDGSVILFDAGRRDLYFAEAVGRDSARLLEIFGVRRQAGIPIDGSKAGRVFTTGQSLRVAALADDDQHFKGVDATTQRATESMMCVPLTVGDNRIGVMQLLNKQNGNYSTRDVVLLEHFANLAAVALRNATLVGDTLAHMGWYESEGQAADALRTMEALRQPAHAEAMTVMFADMRGYNRLCQALERPEQVQSVMNEFLTELAGAVLSAGGIVNKFIGDAVLAIFRGEDTAERAVRCAVEITRRMPVMRQRWDSRTNASLEFLDIGVGIATDEVILGSIGTARMRDFTVMGTGVNLAAHLTRDARQGRRILVDKRTYHAVRSLVTADAPEEFELKKPDQPQGRRYERYCIRGLKDAPAAGDGQEAGEAARPSLQASTPLGRDSIFISYSHDDQSWLDVLRVHLKPHTRKRRLVVWDDTLIKPGAEWKEEIRRALASARVAVLMVSPHFLASDFITDEEVPELLAAAQDAGLTIIWFVVSACSYDQTDIPKYQAALNPERPLDSLTPAELNASLVEVCRKISEALK